METRRARKRLVIIATTFSFCALLAVGVFLLLTPDQDEEHLLVAYEIEEDVQHASEQGIDGIDVAGEYQFATDGARHIGVLLHNPNNSWHATEISYQLILHREGEEPRVREGTTRVLAASSRLILEEIEGFDFARFEFVIQEVDWSGAQHSVAPDLRVRKPIFETLRQDGVMMMRISGELINESASGVSGVELGVLLHDGEGTVRGATRIEESKLSLGESRAFEVLRLYPHNAEVADMTFIISSEAVPRMP